MFYECLNSFYERKESHNPTKKDQLIPLSSPNENCSVSRIFLRYGGAKEIKCLMETGLGTVVLSERIKRKTPKHMQNVKVKDFVKKIR